MRTRNKKLSDYGLSKQDTKKIKECFRNCDGFKRTIVEKVAKEVNPQIADALISSICDGKSFNALPDVYISEADFYAYRRKCFAILKKHIL